MTLGIGFNNFQFGIQQFSSLYGMGNHQLFTSFVHFINASLNLT